MQQEQITIWVSSNVMRKVKQIAKGSIDNAIQALLREALAAREKAEEQK